MNEQNIQQSTESIQSHKNIWILVITIVLTALIVGGVVYFWQNSKMKSAEQSWQQQISVLQDQINQLQQVPQNQQIETLTENEDTRSSSSSGLTEAEALKQKFALDILRFWGVRQVYQYPQNPNIFVYISEDSSGQNIFKFDASKDENYLQDEYPNIPAYNRLLLNVKISSGNEFRGVGFDGSKFIFTETGKNNSPGPCFSPWFYGNLSYIDINASQITRQPYTISNQKTQEVQNEAEECEKNLYKIKE